MYGKGIESGTERKKEKFSEKIEYGCNYSIPVLDEVDFAITIGNLNVIAGAQSTVRNSAQTLLVEWYIVLGGLPTLNQV